MNVASKCKFCGRSLTLEVDDDYAALGDPYKLLNLASCNRCSDFRTERRQIFDRIKFHCMMLLGGGVKKDDLPKKHEVLVLLIKKYMRLLAEFKEAPIPDWDEAVIEDIMAKPGNYALLLAQIPRMFAQPTLV